MAVILAFGFALGVVLLAVRIVVGWVSPKAAVRVDRAVRVAGQLLVVIAGLAIVAVVAAAFR